jgi:hypothetical protein
VEETRPIFPLALVSIAFLIASLGSSMARTIRRDVLGEISSLFPLLLEIELRDEEVVIRGRQIAFVETPRRRTHPLIGGGKGRTP